MAPVKATAVGITPQIIDDPELKELLQRLNSFSSNHDVTMEADVLVSFLEQYEKWRFEEQVDLYEWIPALNTIDAALTHYLQTYPGLLLVPPVERRNGNSDNEDAKNKCAQSLQDAEAVPPEVWSALSTLLTFLSDLLSNSSNKSVFHSVQEVADLLAASNDGVALLALKTLQNVATPPALYKQQAPEAHNHSAPLTPEAHKRLVPLARGWGSRGSGLGLYACVTADDSAWQDLPPEAGEVHFEFLGNVTDQDSAESSNEWISIHLATSDIVTGPVAEGVKKQKRQRTETPHIKGRHTKSTSELFFQSLQQAGGRDRIPQDRLFVLLADIRLARSFYSAQARVAAIRSRLMALIAIINAHPSQDIMSGYFQAQPELCVELMDLLRPTISSSTAGSSTAMESIAALADPPQVPYEIRSLAVEALTALVARRDGASGGLTGVARQSNILNELGVGKGMYLGLLPTLLRYSLASLTNFVTSQQKENAPASKPLEPDDVALDIGLAFVQATKAPSLSDRDQILRALKFVDAVLTLTSAVVSAPSGTAALTDCGMIPALLSTVAFDSRIIIKADLTERDRCQVQALIRFVAAQAIQIVEGAVVTHNNALTAFHDLKGVDLFVKRLESEMLASKQEVGDAMDDGPSRKLVASRRVLLFSIVNCLTVVFHQESGTAATPSGGAQLRKPEMTFVVMDVLQNVTWYGGVLAALICSLLSDVMNSDPHVVYHVHESGIAKAFFDMVKGNTIKTDQEDKWEPIVPPTPELIMALPNVIAALSLTADGASKINEANPFPSLMRILYHPSYVMPNSRCLLNEMTAIVGTGLDEVMRHVPDFRTLVMQSIVDGMAEVIMLGKDLVRREENASLSDEQDLPATSLENERTCLIQYTLNFGQMLEQILHTEDHCDPFVEAGGLLAILDLFPLLVPPATQFLANACCLSSPSVSTLAHTVTEDSLNTSFRCIAINYDSTKMLKVISNALKATMTTVEETQRLVREKFPTDNFKTLVSFEVDSCGALGVLDGLPGEEIHVWRSKIDYSESSKCLADYLRAVVTLQWQSTLLATAIKAACQRSQDGGTGWGRTEREWKKELSSSSFGKLLTRLADFHHSAVLESCRIRSEDDYESEFRKRHVRSTDANECIRYRLRIVCQEGAVVRDGIEIDSCTNVGSMEMGEVVDAYDRCVNSSSVMRYRTRRGWVSELTRGHGREPIAEVIDVSSIKVGDVPEDTQKRIPKRRLEYGVASCRSMGASVLARLQTSYRDLLCSLSRVVSNGVRSLTVRSMSFQSGTVGAHTRAMLKVTSCTLSGALNQACIVDFVTKEDKSDSLLNHGCIAMYFGTLLGVINSCLFDDKRDRRIVNVLLLLSMLNIDNFFWTVVPQKLLGDSSNKHEKAAVVGVIYAVHFVFEHALKSSFSLFNMDSPPSLAPIQSLSRTTAASLPPVLAFLRRLAGGVAIKQSPITGILDRLEIGDMSNLLGSSKSDILNSLFCRVDNGEKKFSPERFVRTITFAVADIVLALWKDQRFVRLPPYVVYPVATLSAEVVTVLEELLKPSSSSANDPRSLFFGRLTGSRNEERDNEQIEGQVFEASEEAVTRLMEMGFSHDHALDAIESTESNRLEVAMEYALSHPPPSPGTIERHREARESRRREARSSNESNGQDINDGADESGSGSMDTQSAVKGETEQKSNNEGPATKDAEIEIGVISKIKDCLQGWIDAAPAVGVTLISEGSLFQHRRRATTSNAEGNGDAEALTVVVSSFLISICQKYPDKSEAVAREFLTRLISNLEESVEIVGTMTYRVKEGFDAPFSALCHGTVVFSRAVPKIRTLILEHGVVTRVMACIADFTSCLGQTTKQHWPVWLAPALLLLEVMAQPMVAFAKVSGEEHFTVPDLHGELSLVKMEHRYKAETLSQMSEQLFAAVAKGSQQKKAKPSQVKSPDKGPANEEIAKATEQKEESEQKPGEKESSAFSETKDSDEKGVEESAKAESPFAGVPPFYPLITDEMSRTALSFCLTIIGKDVIFREGSSPPPGTVHAALLLLMRLLRSSTLATECLGEETAGLILTLPGSCRFKGNAALVTVIFRRLLEDDSNLQCSMETEIRGILMKLHRKRTRGSAASEEPWAPSHSFLQAAIPLLCREPVVFLKALMSTVSLKTQRDDDRIATLLSQEERQHTLRVISSFKFRRAEQPSSEKRRSKHGTPKKTKSPHRSSGTRRGSFTKTKAKKEKSESELNGTPSNHVMTLLIEKLLSLSSIGVNRAGIDFNASQSFVSVPDILEIMADLVLAVPTCAAAIHRYKPDPSRKENRGNAHALMQLSHALSRCPPPSPTVVSFLLHRLLPQDRWSYRQDQEWDKRENYDESRKQKTKESFIKTKVAQTTARLLVALVARSGEGRRRVIADLSFALSGGLQKASGAKSLSADSPPISSCRDELELCAVRAWGDLCIGLASPRSNGVNHDNNANLSIEVVKLMLDFKMVHSLIQAVGCVKMKHPMAASACGSLLVPLEVFTRATVTDAILALAEKEEKDAAKQLDPSKTMKQPKRNDSGGFFPRVSMGPSRRSETAFADDVMLAEDFNAETLIVPRDPANIAEAVVMEVVQHVSDDDIVVDDDADMENVDEEDSEEDSDMDDEEEDSDIDEEDEDDDSDMDDEDDDETNEDEDEEEEESDDEESGPYVEGEPNDNEWEEEVGEIFEDGDDDEEDEAEEGFQERAENDFDEWDQVEAPLGFGGMLFPEDRRRGGNLSNRARGFVDAAEAMLGSLLRTGEIQGDTIAEIEGTLGIRISGRRGVSQWTDRGRMLSSPTDGRDPRRQETGEEGNEGEVIGAVPHVNQRRTPDIGYAGPAAGGRWSDISSIELAFGGPALTGGSSNFDVVSEPTPRENEAYTVPSAVDSQLFPGGPAASTHSRAHQSFHPLLCGVDLPPVNSLVSNLQSHGERSTRNSEGNGRRGDDWTASFSMSMTGLVSTSTGGVMRFGRGQGPHGEPSQSRSGLVNLSGWTDDGQPIDGTIGNFGSAFETALTETIQVLENGGETNATANSAGEEAETRAERASAEPDEHVHRETEAQAETQGEIGAEIEASRDADDIRGENERNMALDTEVGASDSGGNATLSLETTIDHTSHSSEHNVADQRSEENVAENSRDVPQQSARLSDETDVQGDGDGEGVAPSLVEGLRLSDREADDAVDAQEVDVTSESTRSGNGQENENGREEFRDSSTTDVANENPPNANGMVCPPGMDLEVFNSLPVEMQREVVEQHQATLDLAAQLDSASGLDPEALAALPEDMRLEVIAQEQRERRLRESAPADPSNAEEMDNASFVASLAPDLRREILLTAEEAFLSSLPPDIIAEAQLLRERASHGRRLQDPLAQQDSDTGDGNNATAGTNVTNSSSRKRGHSSKVKVERDRFPVIYLSGKEPSPSTEPFCGRELRSLIQLMFLLSPVRPQRLLQKLFHNLSTNPTLRSVICSAFTRILNDDREGTAAVVATLGSKDQMSTDDETDYEFPPRSLVGAAPEVLDSGGGANLSHLFIRRRQGSSCAASIAASLPVSLKGSTNVGHIPPVVSTRVIDTLQFLGKNSTRVCLDTLTNSCVGVNAEKEEISCFEQMLDLLSKPRYAKSSTNLEHLLTMLEVLISPLSSLPSPEDEESAISKEEIEAASSSGKEWVDIPRLVVSQSRLQLLCSTLKMESCRDSAFSKVNVITRRLCKVDANRGHVLGELASVAQALGEDAKRDLRAMYVRMSDTLNMQQGTAIEGSANQGDEGVMAGTLATRRMPSSAVTLTTSNSELKLLRVLQTLQSLCIDSSSEDGQKRRNEGKVFVTGELIEILQGINLSELWDQLTSCLKIVRVLEGISTADEIDDKNGDNEEEVADDNGNNTDDGGEEGSGIGGSSGKKLQNSSAGLLTRFLPAIEAFFVVNASSTRDEGFAISECKESQQKEEKPLQDVLSPGSPPLRETRSEDGTALVGGQRVIDFVSENRVILNALVRNNSSLLDKGMRAMVQVPRCRVFLDFDVKRQWFKTQIRRLRQTASRRHGSLRLVIRRKHVFEDAYHQLRLRNADEMRARLHITFRNEEGVDAGGLSREFFGILAKEMFNPNYALFTSTEDGCTFQPNPNSYINPDHLSYFRFVGRIVGKAVSDGFLLDAHFTRSLYKHMLGLEPTHHDMEAIDPDYYKNLKTIMEYSLADIGLDLTFSIEDHSFGRSQTIDLIRDGRNVAVTDETKSKYVSLVCKHRMTTSIKSQIKAYLDGFYELVSPDLISVFTPRELELLISGLPDIDILDLKENTEYQGWKATDPEIEWFWNVMFSLSRSEKAAFLQFVTGSSKVPLSGFSELQGMRGVQKFSIHKAGGPSGALMSAHTCFNSLDLPKYSSQEETKEKLLYAISEGQGSFQFA